MAIMSKTPRCDLQPITWIGDTVGYVPHEFARQLERDLTKVTAERDAALKDAEQAKIADMFWDADDPENTGSEDLGYLLEMQCDDMREGDVREVDVMCACRLPNIKVNVWVEGDELKWEEIDAAMKEPKS